MKKQFLVAALLISTLSTGFTMNFKDENTNEKKNQFTINQMSVKDFLKHKEVGGNTDPEVRLNNFIGSLISQVRKTVKGTDDSLNREKKEELKDAFNDLISSIIEHDKEIELKKYNEKIFKKEGNN